MPGIRASYAGEIIDWFVQLGHERGFGLLIEGSSPEGELDLISRARAHLIDGLVLNPVRLDEAAVTRLDLHQAPPLVVMGEVAPEGVDRVHVDSVAAAAEMTRHLISRGYRKIGIVGSPTSSPTATSQLRMRGVESALEEFGLALDPGHLVATDDWDAQVARDGVIKMLAGSEPPDALFCFTDTMAFGAYRALYEVGLRVPEDIAVAGFDDIDDARLFTPALTTVTFDRREFVEAALDLLIRRIDNPRAAPDTAVVPHRLAIREST